MLKKNATTKTLPCFMHSDYDRMIFLKLGAPIPLIATVRLLMLEFYKTSDYSI